MTKRKQQAYIEAVEEELGRRLTPFSTIPLFERLCTKIGRKALNLMRGQYNKAYDVYSKNLPLRKPCSHHFQLQYGLPCAHIILSRLQAVRPLSLIDIDRQWHLQIDTVSRQYKR
jgi:hypothetical protein